MAEEISYHLEQLQAMDATNLCGFVHENSHLGDPPQCSDSLQKTRLCCAHSGQNILHNAIAALESEGHIHRTTAELLRQRLRDQSVQLLALDMCAAREYSLRWEVNGSPQSFPDDHEIVRDQHDVVGSLDQIRLEVIDLCLCAVT